MGVLVRKRHDGWYVVVNHRGTRQSTKVGPDKESAEKIAKKVRVQLAEGTLQLGRPSGPLFKEYAEGWLKQHVQVNGIKESTAENYDKSIRLYLVPAFGEKRLTEIGRGDVKAFVARLRENGSVGRPGTGLEQGSVRLMLAPLRLILGEAVDAGLLQSNQAAKIGKFNKRRTEREAEGADPFTREELAAIAKTGREQVKIIWPLVGAWEHTGMRAGEVFGLRWRDLDLEAETVIVRRTLSNGRLGSPKTGRSRSVNIGHPLLRDSERILETFRALRSLQEAEAAVTGRAFDPEGYIFTRPDGRPWDSISEPWRRCLRLAGIRYRNPEQLRHTWASTLLSRGESLLYVQEQGGWTNATTLLKHYSRWLPRQAPRLQPAATHAQPEQVNTGG